MRESPLERRMLSDDSLHNLVCRRARQAAIRVPNAGYTFNRPIIYRFYVLRNIGVFALGKCATFQSELEQIHFFLKTATLRWTWNPVWTDNAFYPQFPDCGVTGRKLACLVSGVKSRAYVVDDAVTVASPPDGRHGRESGGLWQL